MYKSLCVIRNVGNPQTLCFEKLKKAINKQAYFLQPKVFPVQGYLLSGYLTRTAFFFKNLIAIFLNPLNHKKLTLWNYKTQTNWMMSLY